MLALGLILALAANAAAAPTSSASAVPSSSSSAVANRSYLKADGYTSQKWVKGFEKAQSVVSQLTLAEKMCVCFLFSLLLSSSLPSPFPLPCLDVETPRADLFLCKTAPTPT